MTLIDASTTRSFAMHGVTFTSYASSATGAGTVAAWRADFAPQTPGRPHTMTHEEVLYVLTGELAVELGEQEFTARAGDAVVVPAGVVFRVSNEEAKPAHAWVTTSIGMRAAMQPSGEEVVPPWAQ